MSLPKCFRCGKSAAATSLGMVQSGVWTCGACRAINDPVPESDRPFDAGDTSTNLSMFDFSGPSSDPSPDTSFDFGGGGGFDGAGAGGDF